MTRAYSLLGILFVVILIGAYVAIERVEAPSEVNNQDTTMSLTLTSSAFAHNGAIPPKYTCDDKNVNPELQISGVPEGTKSLVLVMDDPDIPQSVKDQRGVEKIDHWVLYNLPPDTTVIPEDVTLGDGGLNSRGEEGYIGPCPPDREHRYIFRLYALSDILNFEGVPTLDEVEAAAKRIMLDSTQFIGRYERSK